jgi:microcystin-dependent protein
LVCEETDTSTYAWRIVDLKFNEPADNSVTPPKITNAAKNEITPIGTVSAFAGASAPDKYLICNGTAISRTTYSDLYAVLGDVYGNGDGSTTFNLPDLRGEFIRGLDGGRGVDASRTLGSSQDDTTRRPRNTSLTTNTTGNHTHVREAFASAGDGGTSRLVPSGVGTDRSTESAGDHNHSITGGGDAETRPRNIALNYIIKAEY